MATWAFLEAAGNILGVSAITVELLIPFTGLLLLAYSFHGRTKTPARYSAPGWVLIGLYFFLATPHYVEIGDWVLVVMCGAALPLGIAMGWWDLKIEREGQDEPAVVWLRGCVFWAAFPYLLIAHMPQLSIAAVYFTASQGVLFLRWAGIANLQMGDPQVQYADGTEVPFSEFDGNQWFHTEALGEGGFYIPLLNADGTPLGISIVLACSALQSMIIFVGALVALRGVSWKLRARAFLLTLPVIHVLNVFRNAGIIWLKMTYPDWHLMGIDIFDFGHSYAAKFGSLFAMFLMAIVLFELLPTLHSHVLRLLDPLLRVIDTVFPPPNRKVV